MNWHNEPPKITVKDDVIQITTGAKTDFWRTTHYGFIRDNGHFYFREVKGDFVAEVKIKGAYESLYDQAGLMARVDENNWVKCGIEFVAGVQQASAVVTREFSDWSIVSLPENPPFVWFKLTRRAEAIKVHFSLDGANYTMLRLAYFAPTDSIKVGLMCASPDGDGFDVAFENLSIRSL